MLPTDVRMGGGRGCVLKDSKPLGQTGDENNNMVVGAMQFQVTAKGASIGATIREKTGASVEVPFVPYDPLSVFGEEAGNVDDMFPDLSKFCFGNGFDPSVEIFMFQPGRKRVYAFITRDRQGCKWMVHVPEKFATLEYMLYAINTSVRVDKPIKIDSFPIYNWGGVNLFPYEAEDSEKFQKYKESGEGFHRAWAREFPLAEQARLGSRFLKTFPKCAAAAGYNQKNKPSKADQRGWIIYRNGTLMLCKGSSKSGYSNAPSPSVWDGHNKHEPIDDDAIFKTISIKCKSLQELFCAAEALW